MVQSAMGYDYQASLSKHQSQTDAAKGFGGKYGVDKESQDAVSRAFGFIKILSHMVLKLRVLRPHARLVRKACRDSIKCAYVHLVSLLIVFGTSKKCFVLGLG